MKFVQYEPRTEKDKEDASREFDEEVHKEVQEQVQKISKVNLHASTTRQAQSFQQPLSVEAPQRGSVKLPPKKEIFVPQKVVSDQFKTKIEQERISPLKTTRIVQEQPARPNSDFTQEDVELLLHEYDAIMNIDEERVIDAWLTWAKAVISSCRTLTLE